MNFSDERYVRVYTRDTATWKQLSWQARAVLLFLLRKVDRAGTADFEGDPAEAVAALCDVPIDVAREALEQLSKRFIVRVSHDAIVFPKFMEAQETIKTDAARAKEYRERKRQNVLDSVTKRDGHTMSASHVVTDRHAASRGVTPICAVPNHAEPSLAEPDLTEPNIATPSAPRPCPAVQAMNETAGASKGRLERIERVSKGQAIHFNRELKPIIPIEGFRLIGEWLAAGAQEFRKNLTYADVLANAITWHETAKGWDRQGRPRLVNGPTSERKSAEEQDPFYAFVKNGAKNGTHKTGV